MALADFIDGFWRAILTRADATVTRAELPADFATRVETALTTFYGSNTNRIETAAGVPGITVVNVAYQAGIEVGIMVSRQRTTANASHWGSLLTSRMQTLASGTARPRIRRDVNGVVTVEDIGDG